MNGKVPQERKQNPPALRAYAMMIQMHFSSFPIVTSNRIPKSKCNDNHQHLNLAQNPLRFVILAPGRSGKSVVSASLSPYDGNRGVRDADCV